MNKKDLTETEIRTRFITPAIRDTAGWDVNRIGEEKYIDAGRIYPSGQKGKRGNRKFADYVLYSKGNKPIAIVEAKDNNQSVGAGMQQALEYARLLDVPFAYSSNGSGFVEHDNTKTDGVIEREFGMHEFPSPDDLWQRYVRWKGISPEEEKIISQANYQGTKTPRYYQQVAINRTVEAIAKGQNRIILVMATGTGKTYTASQIMYRLWKAKKAKRILFLADRNVLVDQAKTNDFKIFGDVMTKISGREIDKSYEIYLSLYQQLTGPDEAMNVFKEFSPDFFDLIFVDECHRGSAAEDSAWRRVLEYFSEATHVGLTATPKETKDVSNKEYFGEPIYTYSLKDGIEDGFLAPYKVIRIELDKDTEGWRPRAGQRDIEGYEIPDDVYYGSDFDKSLVIEERTTLVASLITEHLKTTGRMSKTIIFCRNIAHAEEMRRALINNNSDLYFQNNKYIMRITGDSKEGKDELDSFIDPEEPYPVIVTTSKLLNTGVDTQTVKLIVLESIINSMTEFKQIIGRGSRVREEQGKYYFTIMDFRNATRLFQDKDFDGDPVQIYEPPSDKPVTPPEDDVDDEDEDEEDEGEGTIRYRVRGVDVRMIRERVQYLGKDGYLITESFVDYSRKNLLNQYPTLEEFLDDWFKADRKEAIVQALLDEGVFLDQLQAEVGLDIDPFDLICHIAYDQKALTRSERARNARVNPAYFEKYSETARGIVEALLEDYQEKGYLTFDKVLDGSNLSDFLSAPPLNNFGRPLEVLKLFGGKELFHEAMQELQSQVYAY
jgi:type I restriction enzyme, R subunit